MVSKDFLKILLLEGAVQFNFGGEPCTTISVQYHKSHTRSSIFRYQLTSQLFLHWRLGGTVDQFFNRADITLTEIFTLS